MDFSGLINDLKQEKQKLEHMIAGLESLTVNAGSPNRRGRKFMGIEERKQVSDRMKKYWAARRSSAAV